MFSIKNILIRENPDFAQQKKELNQKTLNQFSVSNICVMYFSGGGHHERKIPYDMPRSPWSFAKAQILASFPL